MWGVISSKSMYSFIRRPEAAGDRRLLISDSYSSATQQCPSLRQIYLYFMWQVSSAPPVPKSLRGPDTDPQSNWVRSQRVCRPAQDSQSVASDATEQQSAENDSARAGSKRAAGFSKDRQPGKRKAMSSNGVQGMLQSLPQLDRSILKLGKTVAHKKRHVVRRLVLPVLLLVASSLRWVMPNLTRKAQCLQRSSPPPPPLSPPITGCRYPAFEAVSSPCLALGSQGLP